MTLQSRGLARSHDKLKPLYLHYHNAYDHKTWHGGELPRVASTHKATWLHKAGIKNLFVCRHPTQGLQVGSVGRDFFYFSGQSRSYFGGQSLLVLKGVCGTR